MPSGYERIAKRLDEQKDRILALWEDRARRSLPAARRTDRLALLDGLPDVLGEMADALAHPGGDGSVQLVSETAPGHGRQRAEFTEYSLDQVIAEYDILRRVLFEILEQAADPLLPPERDALMSAVQAGVAASAREFARARNEERERARAELKAANEALERRFSERTRELSISEARFRDLVEGVKDYAIFTIDPSGYVTSWNRGAERMKGYTAKEIIGTHFSILYPEAGKLRDEPMAHLRTAAIEGRFRGEGLRRRKNADLFLADVLITPMYVGDELAGFSKVVQDLTERNTLMQERDILRSDAERLRDQAQYRERFIATLSHDLRSPLSAAKTGAQLIARAPERPDRVRQWALRITDAVDRADRMIVDLLDASRLDAGQELALQMVECDLQQIADDVCSDLATRFGDRFVIETVGATNGHWDPDALWRVLENLLANAVKYGDPTAPVRLGLKRLAKHQVITVKNEGTIIPVTEQAKLFQPYHRSSEATASGKIGWGLGLTLVRGIVDAHKGNVKVESYPVDGTTFTVDLPVDAREPREPP